MTTLKLFFSLVLVLLLAAGSLPAIAQLLPEYQLTVQNPVLLGTDYQFDIYVKRVGGTSFRIGNAQFILSFNAGAFTAPAITRQPGSELTGSGFFFDQVISSSELRLTLGGNGSYALAADIGTVGAGTRISTYRISGVNVDILSTMLTWINTSALIHTGISEIDPSDNYRDVTDFTGASHINGGGEFARVSGFVFEDLNGNGNWEQPPESPLNGWTVTLTGPNGPYAASSGGGSWPAGYFEFNNLTPGTFSLSETLQPGWSPTAFPPDALLLVAGQFSQDNNFGNFNGPTVRGRVFNDLNANAVMDLSEPGLTGWQLTASKVGGSETKTQLSNGGGNYVFTFQSSESGDWVISETPLPGWSQTLPPLPHTYQVSIQSGSFFLGKDFGNFLPSTIGGTKYNDLNGDSTLTPGELGIEGWQIVLQKDHVPIDTAVTDVDGHYEFGGLPSGSYSVAENLQTGWIVTQPAPLWTYDLTIDSGGTVISGRDFGNFQLGSISGFAYYDVNHNGTFDGLEIGMAGLQITAVSPSGTFTATTLPGGTWTIPNLLAGYYTITEQPLTNYHLTEPALGGYSVHIVSGSNVTDLRFGNSAAADTVKYRTISYDSLAASMNLKGKAPYPVPRKANRIQFSGYFVNNTGKAVDILHLIFKLRVEATDLSFPFVIRPVPQSITWNLTQRAFDITFPDTLKSGDTVSIVGWTRPYSGAPGLLQVGWYRWNSGRRNLTPVSNKLQPADFVMNAPRWPMPNAMNVPDELFRVNAFGSGGLIVGVDRSDGMKYYGWVRIKKALNFNKSVLDRSGPHLIAVHGFDLYNNSRIFLREQIKLPPSKQNNLVFADLLALRCNIFSSDLGIMPQGLGDLIYDDGVSPLSGMAVRDIAAKADTLLTMWMGHTATDYSGLDDVMQRINSAFEGTMDTLSFAAGLVLAGVRPLQAVPYLRANPMTVRPIVQVPRGTNSQSIPEYFNLCQNYPNPFNPTTRVRVELPDPAIMTLKVYNLLGQEVATLADRQFYEGGVEEFEFNASALASGIYFLRLSVQPVDEDMVAAGQLMVQTRKMLLVK